MKTNTRPAVGRLLLGTLFLSLGVAAIVAGTSSVNAGPALGLALVVGGAVTLGAVVYGRQGSSPIESVETEPFVETHPTADDLTGSAIAVDDEPDLLEQAALLDDSY